MNAINQMLNELMQQAGYAIPDKQKAHSEGKCVRCGEIAHGKIHTPLGAKEYQISGLCEDCWNVMFKDDEE